MSARTKRVTGPGPSLAEKQDECEGEGEMKVRRRPEWCERGRDRREGKRVDCEAKPAPPRVVMSASWVLPRQLYARCA